MSYKPEQYDLNNKHFTLYEPLLNLRIKTLVRIKVFLISRCIYHHYQTES